MTNDNDSSQDMKTVETMVNFTMMIKSMIIMMMMMLKKIAMMMTVKMAMMIK